MNSHSASFRSQRSERVRRLFAALVKRLIQTQLDCPISDGEAFDLAAHASLSEALASVRERLEILKQFPDPRMRLTLALKEASLVAGTETVGEAYVQSEILKARGLAHSVLDAKNTARRNEQLRTKTLKERMAEIKSWGRVHSRFIGELQKLYSDALYGLNRLNLRQDRLLRAIEELNDIFEASLTKGLSLESNRSRPVSPPE